MLVSEAMGTPEAHDTGPHEEVIGMPHTNDAQKRFFEAGIAEKAELNKKKVADSGQKIEVEQHRAVVDAEREAERLLEQEREHG